MPIPRALIFSVDRLLWLKDTIKDKIFPTDVKEPACNIYHLNWEDNDEDKFLIINIDVEALLNPYSWLLIGKSSLDLENVLNLNCVSSPGESVWSSPVVPLLCNLLHTSATPARPFIHGNKDIKLKLNSNFTTVFWEGRRRKCLFFQVVADP